MPYPEMAPMRPSSRTSGFGRSEPSTIDEIGRSPDDLLVGVETRRRLWVAAALGTVLAIVVVIVLIIDGLIPVGATAEAATEHDRSEVHAQLAAPLAVGTDVTTHSRENATFRSSPATKLYGTPESAARAFAILAGFEDPLIGPFRSTTSKTGDVDITPEPDGPITVAKVEQTGSGWIVRSAVATGIELDQPAAGDVLGDLMHYTGTAWSPNGSVDISIRARAATTVLAAASIPTTQAEPPVPFEGAVGWWQSVAGAATVIAVTRTPEGGVWEATAIPIDLAGQPSPPADDPDANDRIPALEVPRG